MLERMHYSKTSCDELKTFYTGMFPSDRVGTVH